MTQQSHLHPVGSSADGGDSTSAGRGPQRQRAAKAFPTDRMKMDRQIAVLRTLGRLSGPRKDSVDGNALSKAVGGVAATTVILSNRFFADAGWIANSGKGLYAATDALVEYTRRLATGAADPAEVLRETARRSWFWELLEPRLANGRLAVNEAAILLMREADATDSHMPMILSLIAWMEHVGLISVRDNFITAEDDGHSGDGDGAASAGPAAEPQLPADLQSPAGSEGEKSTVPPEESFPAAVVAFGLDVQLTVADLALLTPEQIKAFFESIGALAAIRQKR
jgi:hypothetical protein